MPLNVVVIVKQVIDPETKVSALRLDLENHTVSSPSNAPPVVNGFDDQAVEAALRLKDGQGAHVTVISAGSAFTMAVIKKPISMGCDEMVLLQDSMFENMDSFGTAQVLAAAIKKIGDFDLILGGRQASDWDNAQTPLGLAEFLGIPCITMAKKVDVTDSKVIVERVIPDGHEVIEASLPSLVIVSNELGQPRFPTITNTMAAVRKIPKVWTAEDLEISISGKQVRIMDLFVPVIEKDCEFIEGENEEDVGRKLALTLREAKLI